MNDQIVKRIKDLRKERGLKQQDLADKLGRTAAAISDLERGKVQVTASDLYQLADLLGKPIEYFFGESKYPQDIEDVITLILGMDPETRALQLPAISSLVKLQLQSKQMGLIEDLSQDEIKEHATLIYNNLITYLHNVREMYSVGIDVKGKLEVMMGIGENELPPLE